MCVASLEYKYMVVSIYILLRGFGFTLIKWNAEEVSIPYDYFFYLNLRQHCQGCVMLQDGGCRYGSSKGTKFPHFLILILLKFFYRASLNIQYINLSSKNSVNYTPQSFMLV